MITSIASGFSNPRAVAARTMRAWTSDFAIASAAACAAGIWFVGVPRLWPADAVGFSIHAV